MAVKTFHKDTKIKMAYLLHLCKASFSEIRYEILKEQFIFEQIT